eukprot:Gregarina_sp_Pseudo_9__309@NODE_11_length_6581_cov_205_655304_g9_i0_p7_GENE_NODE_11_length_6581_cov_205_655304_g9_i0NODE_11_length_6581_cov_205_655304_g9_i0_p7_ORF_typecomplete_len191_score32_98DUF3297/PF11730_8/0_49DUF3297/PF11730_8/2_9e03_NODE_11_length_6581_cov_205_655304_g9_i020442616
MSKEQIIEDMTELDSFKTPVDLTSQCSDLCGKWMLLLHVSESCDKILEACGFSRIKRMMFKSSVTQTWVDNPDANAVDENGQPLQLRLKTLLPMNTSREMVLRLDGSETEYVDDFTQETWTTCGFWDNDRHCMIQKRCSPTKGVHYDMRRVFRDGSVVEQQAPVMLFRWVVVTHKGAVLKADRWLVRLDE